MAKADDTVSVALERFKTAQTAWSDVYEKAKDDLYFLSDEPNAQWDKQTLDDRRNRPIYTIDQLGQFIHQVSNDVRMNTPAIHIIPTDEKASIEQAEILSGIIKGIEYKSNADAAYDTAVDFSIKSSIGFIRVDHDYVDDKGFEQELLIKRVVNPQSCYIDPNSIQSDGSDAMYGFVLEEMLVADFNDQYPDFKAVSFGTDKPSKDLTDKDKITICEYFKIVDEKVSKGLTDKGEIEDYNPKKKYKSKRDITVRKVYRYKLSGQDVLETTTFPGKYIPIVPVYGEEAWIEGKRNLYSLIRKSKSSQKLFNLGISLDVEILMKQPQASFMAAAGQISGFEHEYLDPAKANVLHYNVEDVNGNKLGAPQRVQAPVNSIGFMNLSRTAIDNIKSTMGLYNASAGKREGDASGVALKQLEQSGDVSTFHFSDNLVRSITHVGKILVCAMPEIYDTPRAVPMVDKEDNTKMVGINGYKVADQEEDVAIGVGSYDVRVVSGPSYTTQRQEASAFYAQLITAMPDLMPVIGDLVFKYQDSAGAPAISARLKKLVDPKLLDESERDEGIDPQVQALTAQLQQITTEAQMQIQALQQEIKNKEADTALKAAELEIKAKEVDIKAMEAQAKIQEAGQPDMASTHDQTIKEREIRLKEAEFELKVLQSDKESNQGDGEMPIEDTLEVLQAKMQALMLKKQAAEQQQAELAMLEQSRLEREAMEKAEEAAEKEEKRRQSEMLLQGLGAIQQTVAQLVQSTKSPISIIRDENGNITGAR